MNYEIKGRPQRHCNFRVGAVGSACLSLWRLGTRLPGLTCKQRCAMIPLPPVKKPAAPYNTVPTDLFTFICYYSLRVVGSWHGPLLPPHLWPHSVLQSLLPQAEPGRPPASHLLSPSHTPSSFWALFPGVKLPNDLIPGRTLSSQQKQTVSATLSLLKPNPVNNTVHFKIQNCTFHILSPQIECRSEASNVFISLAEPQTQSGFNSCGESFFNEKESCRCPVIS